MALSTRRVHSAARPDRLRRRQRASPPQPISDLDTLYLGSTPLLPGSEVVMSVDGEASDQGMRGGGGQRAVVADDELELAVAVGAGVAQVASH